MADKLLRPSKKIKLSDLEVAAGLAGGQYVNELLHTVALVQQLEEGQRLFRARDLKHDVVDKFVRVISGGESGLCSDIRTFDTMREPNIRMVVAGKMIEVERDDFVVVNVQFLQFPDRTGYIKLPQHV